MEITQYDEHTWIFYHNGVRFFLLEGEEKAALIDTGMHAGNVFELARERTEKPLILLNTPADMDHVGGNEE
ncbi:MAG: MBL fold metallo-hydrolase, partial [Solobacterium sp.]|nr:MBL fold metallo-hydrolase [Solobacterium sp.]